MAQIPRAIETLSRIKEPWEHLAPVARVDMRPGLQTLQLSCEALAQALDCLPDQINPTALMIKTPLGMRRRGVELKLHLGDAPLDDLSTD